GRSFPIVLQEVFAFYEAGQRGEAIELPAPKPFGEYVEWLCRKDFEPSRAYWQATLRGFTHPTPLGVGRVHEPKLGIRDVEPFQEARGGADWPQPTSVRQGEDTAPCLSPFQVPVRDEKAVEPPDEPARDTSGRGEPSR